MRDGRSGRASGQKILTMKMSRRRRPSDLCRLLILSLDCSKCTAIAESLLDGVTRYSFVRLVSLYISSLSLYLSPFSSQIELRGFSIGAKQSISALIIGPGPGYNLVRYSSLSLSLSLSLYFLPLKENVSQGSNPPTADEAERSKEGSSRKKSSLFLDNIRAERESFRAIFDRRRQRIGGFDDADDDYL